MSPSPAHHDDSVAFPAQERTQPEEQPHPSPPALLMKQAFSLQWIFHLPTQGVALGWYEGDPWPPNPPPGLLSFLLSTFCFSSPWPRHARKRIAPLSLPDAFAQVGGDPFRQENPLWRTHVTTCILLERAVKNLFLPIPLLSGRICCFVDPARPGPRLPTQTHDPQSTIHDPQSSIGSPVSHPFPEFLGFLRDPAGSPVRTGGPAPYEV